MYEKGKQYQGKLFIIILFLLGLVTVIPYGAHLDQKSEQAILYSNIKEYLCCFGGTESALYHQFDANGIIEISDSIERDHGMAVFYPVFWIFYVNQSSPFIGNIIWHVYIYLLVFCGVAATYGLIQSMFHDFRVSSLTTLLFFFSPRMFAESHYNNKDMILLSLTLCMFYFGWKLCRELTWKYVIAFSVTGSLASNMKIIGMLVWGMTGLYILGVALYNHQYEKKFFIKMMTCIVLTGVVYMLVTPACWTGPVEFIQYLVESARNFRWNDYILFAGSMYNKNTTGMPRAYLPVMILLTVPIGIFLLFFLGLIVIPFKLIRKPSCFFGATGYGCIVFLAGIIPLCYAILSGTPVYNGWRHFYFCYGSILIMAAYGISVVFHIAEKYRGAAVAGWMFGIYLMFLILGVLINHPYEYAYYNFLAGNHRENFYELDYWDMSFKQAYEIILKRSSDEEIKIGTISNPARWGLDAQLYAIRGKSRMRINLCDDWQDAQYLIINPMYAYMYEQDNYDWIKRECTLVDTITSYGNVICEIYEK